MQDFLNFYVFNFLTNYDKLFKRTVYNIKEIKNVTQSTVYKDICIYLYSESRYKCDVKSSH